VLEILSNLPPFDWQQNIVKEDEENECEMRPLKTHNDGCLY